jgi:hypothetical protein
VWIPDYEIRSRALVKQRDGVKTVPVRVHVCVPCHARIRVDLVLEAVNPRKFFCNAGTQRVPNESRRVRIPTQHILSGFVPWGPLYLPQSNGWVICPITQRSRASNVQSAVVMVGAIDFSVRPGKPFLVGQRGVPESLGRENDVAIAPAPTRHI